MITRDKRVRTRPGEIDAMMAADLRPFCLTDAGNATRWQVLDLLVRRWPRIEAIAASQAGALHLLGHLAQLQQIA